MNDWVDDEHVGMTEVTRRLSALVASPVVATPSANTGSSVVVWCFSCAAYHWFGAHVK